MTLPGRTIRSHPIAPAAVNPARRISHTAMSVPVRPRPARQWTATAPGSASQTSRKLATMASDGTVQSVKKRSCGGWRV